MPPTNMTILKRIAHNLLRQDRSLKEGIANKAAGGGLEQELPAPCPMRVYRTGNELLLWGQRLSAGGAYEDIAPLYMVGGQPIYHSDKLGAFCMLDEGGNIHTLQTWDEERGVWLDPVRARDPGCRRRQAGGSSGSGSGHCIDHLPNKLSLPTETAGCIGRTGLPCAGHPGHSLAESPVGARRRGMS